MLEGKVELKANLITCIKSCHLQTVWGFRHKGMIVLVMFNSLDVYGKEFAIHLCEISWVSKELLV